MKKHTYGLLEIHVAVLLFGFSGLFGKFLSLSPFSIVLGRTFIAAITLALVILLSDRAFRFHSKKDCLVFVLLGLILSVHWTTFFYSIQISTVAIGLLTVSTFPMFVTFMEPPFFEERLYPKDIFFAFLVFLGLTLVIPSFDMGNQMTQGAIWGTVSGFTFALLSLLNRKYVKAYSSLSIAFYQNGFAALILIPVASANASMPNAHELMHLILLGVFCTACAHALFIKGLARVRAQVASIIAGLEPVYGILLALFLLGEVPSIRMVAGGAVIIGTTVAASMKQKAH